MFIFWSMCSHVCYPYSLHHFCRIILPFNQLGHVPFIRRYRRRFPYSTCLHALYYESPVIISFALLGNSFSMLLLLNDRYART
jgi:hypothetical protein